jgi:hypothetical protein
MLALGYIQERVHREWRALDLEPIGLHKSRHTAATWLDHAGSSWNGPARRGIKPTRGHFF